MKISSIYPQKVQKLRKKTLQGIVLRGQGESMNLEKNTEKKAV